MAYNKLQIDDYDLSGMDVDEERNFNHENCSAGTDRKRRLYIKRVHNGYVYYCHHCSERGIISKAGARHAKSKGKAGLPTRGAGSDAHGTSGTREDVGRNAEYSYGEWPREARHWIGKAGLTEKEIRDAGIFYDCDSERVVLPIRVTNSSSGSGIWQYRRIKEDTGKRTPKYTTRSMGIPNRCTYNCPTGSDTICIVEDVLSAIKVARHCDSYPLTCTNINSAGIRAVTAKEYKRAVIWLDDDKRQVKRDQLVLKSVLGMFFEEVEIIHTNGKDPKEHSDNEIKDLLKL